MHHLAKRQYLKKRQNVKKYCSHGTSLNRNKENSGRRRTAHSEKNIERVRSMLENNPRNVSARRNCMGLSAATFNRITHEGLHWYPYRVKVRQQLKENNFQCLSNFSYWFLQHCNNPPFLSNIVIGDEVNTWNIREYTPKGQVPEFICERNDSREKITVWVGLCGNGTLLGLYIFDRNVSGYNYLQMINSFTFPQLQEHFNNQFDGVFQHLWWFQDGSPAHR